MCEGEVTFYKNDSIWLSLYSDVEPTDYEFVLKSHDGQEVRFKQSESSQINVLDDKIEITLTEEQWAVIKPNYECDIKLVPKIDDEFYQYVVVHKVKFKEKF